MVHCEVDTNLVTLWTRIIRTDYAAVTFSVAFVAFLGLPIVIIVSIHCPENPGYVTVGWLIVPILKGSAFLREGARPRSHVSIIGLVAW